MRIERKLWQHDMNQSCELRMQGNFQGMENIDNKISYHVYYGWKVSDRLVKFWNQLMRLQNKDHDRRCSICNEKSVAHLMNSCGKYKDLYS